MHLIFLSDSLIHVLYPNVYIYMCTVKSTLRSLGRYNIYGVRSVGTLNVAPGDLVWFLGGVVTMPCDGKAVLRLVVAADDVTVVLCIRGCFNSDP